MLLTLDGEDKLLKNTVKDSRSSLVRLKRYENMLSAKRNTALKCRQTFSYGMPSTMDFNRDQLKVLSQSIVVNNLVQKQTSAFKYSFNALHSMKIHSQFIIYLISRFFFYSAFLYISGKFHPLAVQQFGRDEKEKTKNTEK